jgi:small-conductance mechanosensitive channel/CRP-like cAMP-binding protein
MIAGISFVPAALLVLTLIAVAVLRSRPTAIKIGCEVVMLLLIGVTLVDRGTSPLPMDDNLAHAIDAPWLRALAVVWWLIAARLVATLTALGLGRDARSRQARLFSDLLAGGIYLTAVLIILNSVLDLPVKGLLATSGVIAIVLGLALQNTLADVFSGIAVGLEQPFHVGDRITIADHAEGIVVEMNWRSIRIQTDGEDVATIPNSIVARSQIINRSVPTARRGASIEIPTLSISRSERLVDLVQQALLLCPEILVAPAPSVALKRIGTRTTTIGVTYFVASTAALTPARSQLLRQVRRLFRHAGVNDGAIEPPATLLRDLTLFESLSREQVEQLATETIPHGFEPGDVLMEQGSVGASLYVVSSGIFEISRRRNDGSTVVYGRIGPGEYVGEIGMMSGDPRSVTIVAVTSGAALELPRTALASLLAQDKTLSAALERSVHRGLALLDRDGAARECQPLDQGGSILQRIRTFLGSHSRIA